MDKPSDKMWFGFDETGELFDEIDPTRVFDDEEVEKMIGEKYQEEDATVINGR